VSTAVVDPGPGAAPSSYAALAGRLLASGLVNDPWIDGRPRFDPIPLSLTRAQHGQLAACAESVALAHEELVRLVTAEPALLGSFFGMSETERVLFALSAPAWHGIARADVFFTDDGPRCCEINCDTPSGLAEAIALGDALAVSAEPAADPNRHLARRFAALIASFADTLAAPGRAARDRPEGPLTVGIVYPTELTEDLGLVALYRRWLEERGARVVLGSPYNLVTGPDDRVALMGTPCDLLLRHYKTDWWGERRPIWRDEPPLPDAEPLVEPLRAIVRATLAGRVVVVNPFGAVLPQNKRALAFLWEHRARFSPAARAAVAGHVPVTMRLEAADRDQIERERELWVLKSDYGCEGEEVIIGGEVSAAVWRETLDACIPRRWIAQRRFHPRRDAAGMAVNYGVYLVAGRAAGLYCRRSAGATDRTALSMAARVLPDATDARPRPHGDRPGT